MISLSFNWPKLASKFVSHTHLKSQNDTLIFEMAI